MLHPPLNLLYIGGMSFWDMPPTVSECDYALHTDWLSSERHWKKDAGVWQCVCLTRWVSVIELGIKKTLRVNDMWTAQRYFCEVVHTKKSLRVDLDKVIFSVNFGLGKIFTAFWHGRFFEKCWRECHWKKDARVWQWHCAKQTHSLL